MNFNLWLNLSFKHREIQKVIKGMLPYSVVDRWRYQDVQTADFQLVAVIMHQSLDLLNTMNKGISIFNEPLCRAVFGQVKCVCLICERLCVFQASEIKLGQDTH